MDIQVKGTSIQCSFTRMLVLDTWLSVTGSTSDADRCRQVFQTLTQLLPDIENVNTDELLNRITYLCKRLVIYWKQVHRSYSRFVAKYSDWLNDIEVCDLSIAAGHGTQQPVDEELPSTSRQQHRKEFTDCSKSPLLYIKY